jgi:hypothetical protein
MSDVIISSPCNESDRATSELATRIHESIWEDVLGRLCSGCQREADCEAGYEPDSAACARRDAYGAIDECVKDLAYNIVHPVIRMETEEAA